MKDLTSGAGVHFRRLRTERGATLVRAAAAMNISAAALSRMERDQRRASREDIERAIEFYGCTPWEATVLYNAAGLMPLSPPPYPTELFRRYSLDVMSKLPYPAFMTDRLMNILAWNGSMHAIWQPPLGEPIHLLDNLFSPRVRGFLGEGWRPYIVRAAWLFYGLTVTVADQPSYRRLLQRLHARHGDEFVSIWNDALQDGHRQPTDLNDAGLHFIYGTPVGQIEYVVLQSMRVFPSLHDIFVYIPYGAENLERNRAFEAQIDAGRVFEAPSPRI